VQGRRSHGSATASAAATSAATPTAALREVLQEGAQHAGVQLLPAALEKTLDQLHELSQHGQVGPPITNLDQPLGAYLQEKGTTPHFGIELVLAFRVNTRWAVAP
jgi:hypothetical protein